MTLGLTGGIGSGKSTVAKLLQSAGAVLVDADEISKQTTQPGGMAMQALEAAFGKKIIARDGGLDRDAMRSLILADANAKATLEAIVHPLVRQRMLSQKQAALEGGCRHLVLDIPLLVEGGAQWRCQVDAVWVIDCRVEIQIARVISRSGWPQSQVEQVLAAQVSRQQRLSCADVVIYNDNITLEELAQHVFQQLNVLEFARA